MPHRHPISFVLVEPRYEGNVGAVARALKNTGFTDLRLVNPCPIGEEARRMACASEDVLDGAARYESLSDAVADAGLVVALTARDRRDLRDSVSLGEAVGAIVAASANAPVALLFGREDRGLTTEELAPCQLLVRIPAALDRLVYNLAQAVLITAFQLRDALGFGDGSDLGEVEGDTGGRDGRRGPRLTAGARGHLVLRARGVLEELGYAEHADAGLIDRIEQRIAYLIDQAGLDESDHAMLLGVVRRLEERLGRPTPDRSGQVSRRRAAGGLGADHRPDHEDPG